MSLALHTPLTAAAPRYERLVMQLHRLARAVGAQAPGAAAELQQWLREVEHCGDPRSAGLYTFGAALAQRLAGRAAAQANLYLQRFERPQIELFNLLGRAVPFVGLATTVCNQAILRAAQGRQRLCLIDIGIGTGRQLLALLPALAARGLRELCVVGIEPAEPALRVAEAQLQAAAAELGLALQLLPLPTSVELLNAQQWTQISACCAGEPPIVNASFALHHIADDGEGQDRRQQVLQSLQALDPALLVLAEPDVDHLEAAFYPRFRNCFAHFGAVFAALDALDLAPSDRDALKVGFFGREIADILAQPEGQRSERHESAASWLRRLGRAGFDARVDAADALPLAQGPVRLRRRAYHLSLEADGEPVVALFTARPHRDLH
jgi:hypothetical protein